MYETINGPAIDYRPFSSKTHDKPSLPEHQPKRLGQPLHGSPGLEETSQSRPQFDLTLKVRARNNQSGILFCIPLFIATFLLKETVDKNNNAYLTDSAWYLF